jgi:hypothetical protein
MEAGESLEWLKTAASLTCSLLLSAATPRTSKTAIAKGNQNGAPVNFFI